MPPRPGKASTSSAETKLLGMETVAPVRFALSGAATVMPPSIAVGPWFSVNARLPLVVTVGASLTAATLTVLVAGVTEAAAAASVTLQEIVRAAVAGLSDEFAYVTLRSAVW